MKRYRRVGKPLDTDAITECNRGVDSVVSNGDNDTGTLVSTDERDVRFQGPVT